MPKRQTDDSSLKRLGGGRWQTRDERFTIEPQSGTWVVVDAEQADDLGLPLVRGPFPSLMAAKAAIEDARTSEPAESPLAKRIAKGARATEQAAESASKVATPPDGSSRSSRSSREPSPAAEDRSSTKVQAGRAPEPVEPRWLADLTPADRRRARRQIERLTEAGAQDAEGLVRRDAVGGVPTVAAFAIKRRMAKGGGSAQDVLEVLADGRDEDLDVRWRLVDGAGRPIRLD